MLASPPVPLTDLLTRLEVAVGPDADEGAWLVRVVPDDLGLSIGLLELDSEDTPPVSALLGFRADPSWVAAGLVFHGSARTLDDDGKPGERRRVRAVHAVTVDGEEASILRYLDDPGATIDPGPAEGRLTDCCKRILGLPTPRPPAPLLHWFATVWLGAVLGRLASEPARPLSWPDIVGLHPLADPCALQPRSFATHVADHIATTTWESLRFEVSAGAVQFGRLGTLPNSLVAHVMAEVPPTVAGWMDEGMFARWLLSAQPDPIDLLIDLADLMAGSGLEPLIDVLQAWHLW